MYGTSAGDIREVGDTTVICLPSVNVEISVPVSTTEFQEIQAQNPHLLRRGKKISVRGIKTYDATVDHAGGGVGFIIITPTGEQIRFVASTTSPPITGGSSSTTANALVELDIRDVAIVSAVGNDPYGRHIIETLGEERGLRKLTLFERSETAASVILREPDGTATILSCKPAYSPSREALEQLLSTFNPAVLVATAVRPDDLPLVEPLWRHPSPKMRAFSPHIDLVAGDAGYRKRARELCREATLVHINSDEAARLFELRDGDGSIAFPSDNAEATRIMREHAPSLGAHIVCVTRGAHGSIAYEKNGGNVLLQEVAELVEDGNPVGAGDVHLACLLYYLKLRGKTICLRGALEVAAHIAAAKIAAGDPRPWAGVPPSEARKPWVRKFY